ncbi:MAG: hypothetical protein HN341_12945 [Verrucomicrobia bacterium]|nr:hypothetical protein [Verrucomicrobiota bacterium]
MKRSTPYAAALGAIALMVPLPLLGLWFSGRLAPHHTEFPPLSHYVEHAPFSWIAFIAMATAIVACCLPFILKTLHSPSVHRPPQVSALSPHPFPHPFPRPFPLWGWAAVAFTAATWIVAWTRFSWATPIQSHTFSPLWIGYIVVVSALTQKRKGSCLLTAQPIRMLILFATSALFWWYFEYLNRFVQNWFYFGVESFSPSRYFWFATLPFATVLPAVLATEEWLSTFPKLDIGLDQWHRISIRNPKRLAAGWLLAGSLSLMAIGLIPNLLYPLLWISPLIMITAGQAIAGAPTIFTRLRDGNWQGLYRAAIAALICGFFWEMWNSHSAAGWTYAVPYVGRFKLFEMPILGFAGYLPFGLECAVFADLILKQERQSAG